MRLLVFEDDVAIGRLVVRIATMAGFDAVAVTNAAAFQSSLRETLPQVIVLDLQLGATDGVEQLRFLAEQQYAGALIVISGFDARVLESTAVVARHLGLNVAAILAKPIGAEALEQILERLQAASQPISAESVLAAIRNDEMSLDFQPIVSRLPRRLKKLEALIRWDHPALGRLPPNTFVPVAEANDAAIDALTDWVLAATVDAYAVLGELGVNVPISVNVTSRNLHDLTFPDRLAKRLEAGGMPAAHLCLEITETAASQDTALVTDVLTRVRLKGIQLAIDDFGTGHSSLKILRHLPFSEIKIDRSFVAEMTAARDPRVIVKSIIDLATNLEMDTVAEGVETEETARLLEEMQVGALQGHLIASPMPVEAVPAWLSIWLATDNGVVPVQPPESAAPRAANTAGNVVARSPAGVQIAGTADQPAPAVAQAKLTQRQLEVMQLLSIGCSVKEIARKLQLSIGTVKVHLSMAYSALGARNRVEAIIRLGQSTNNPATEVPTTE